MVLHSLYPFRLGDLSRALAQLALAALELERAGYNPDQPRWPAGTSGEPKPGGRWSPGDPGSAGGSSDGWTDAAYQGEYHDILAQHEIEQYRKTGATCVSEARLTLGLNTARIDILCRSAAGQLIGVEVKTGNDPTLTYDQVAVYSHSLAGGPSSPDSKISQLGFSPDELMPPFPIIVVYAQGPDAPKRFFGPIGAPK